MKQQKNKITNVTFDNQYAEQNDGKKELLSGLQKKQKSINPKYFYNAKGSELFDRITRQPEYYPTRTEIKILQQFKHDIAEYCGSDCMLIEPGSGSSEKVRLLLDAIQPEAYIPLDISAEFLHQSALQLGEEFPWLDIHAICADFGHNWTLSKDLPEGKRIIFYPGSTIGNLEPEEAITFLSRIKEWMGIDGGIVIGVDLHKSTQQLQDAYNDAEGITAEFNLNVLDHINPILNAEFDKNTFSHRAFYNNNEQRIEMHLVSQCEQNIRVNGSTLHFAEQETIHTENSYKYTLDSFAQLAAAANLQVSQSWLDQDKLFSVHFLEKAA